jgi:hypothetical protein
MVCHGDANLSCENIYAIKVYRRWFIMCGEVGLEINAEKN